MKKILFAASTLSHIENFHIPYLEQFKKQGYLVHVIGKPNNKSALLYIDKIIPISFEKNMFSIKNFALSIKIAKIIREENYDIVSIHTSLAAFFTRLGIMLAFKKPKLVINTVHGYLFDDRSPFLKKTIMLLAEKLNKSVTDIIIVMNSFDYNIAQKYRLCTGNVYSINGMGINSSLFPQISFEKKLSLRHELNLSKDDFILIYVAEFSQRKNQKFLLQSIAKLVKDNFTNIKLLLLGDGALLEDAKKYVEQLGICNNVIFTGYTKNTCTYYQASDICVSSSRIEGLPFNIMEAMSIGLPIVASKVKGHTDLVFPNRNGFLFDYDNTNEFCNAIITLYKNSQLYTQYSLESKYLSKKYSLDAVLPNTVNIICNEYKARL